MSDPKAGNLAITLATYVFLLAEAGYAPDHGPLQSACASLRDAAPGTEDALGEALVGIVRGELGAADPGYDAVVALLGRLYGAGHVGTSLGADREERLHAARRYQFQQSLPWLAMIVDRFPDGSVGPHWVLVERVTDVVRCMDPYPWDEVNEEIEVPVVEFLVKWELAGARSVHRVA